MINCGMAQPKEVICTYINEANHLKERNIRVLWSGTPFFIAGLRFAPTDANLSPTPLFDMVYSLTSTNHMYITEISKQQNTETN
jgi:hypothetical protein